MAKIVWCSHNGMDLLAEDPRCMLEVFNLTDDATMFGYSLPRLLERAANRYFDKTALVCAGTELTYKNLNARANRFARVLVKRGIGRGDLVSVALDRSIDLVVALVAVLKSGAAYVPIDPAFPAKRMEQMMKDAAPRLVIADDVGMDSLMLPGNVCFHMDEVRREIGLTADDRNLEVDIRAEDLAYVMYTSGSTGAPKGVEVSHGGLANLALSAQREPGWSEEDRLLAISTISFDMAVYELLVPLASGVTAIIAQTHQLRNPGALLHLMQHHDITLMVATPSTWQTLLHAGWRGKPRLRTIICAGETLSRTLAERLLDYGDTVWNAYGPTEASVCASCWKVRKGEEVLIGNPIPNARLYVLDTDLSPVPLGSMGELYIGGAGVARGYRNNLQLTKERFINNPFHKGRMYRTGDLASFVAPRKLRLLGRADSQVKIRGHRIELGDIEAVIAGYAGISKTAVVNRDGRLVAYCVRQPRDVTHVDLARVVAEWAVASDRVYEAQGSAGSFNVAGWSNSYDGQAFSAREMRDWQMSSVRRILSYCPKRVLEIGAGSGLMLFSIAPQCSVYYATDSSKKAVAAARRHLGSLPHVVYEHREAHALPMLERAFDTIIINSVAQYFPSIYYLVSVIEWATKAIDNGRVYLGDLRNLALLELFHADVIDFRAKGQITPQKLARCVAHAVRSEQELAISPEFFANLPSMFPRIARVDITLRDGRYDNEMTRYRFDVTLHIGNSDNLHLNASEVNWSDHHDMASLRRQLAMTGRKVQRFNTMPNGRLRDVHSRVATALGKAFELPSTWVNPQDLVDIATNLDLQVALLPSRSGGIWSFDAVFWRAGGSPDLTLRPAEAMCRQTLARYANTPAFGEPAEDSLASILRSWLTERLPAYMVPAFFIELDDLPVTFNGKIDYKALPDPVESIEVTEKPSSELERDIVVIWSNILGHENIGVSDNFFHIGGDSVRLVRVQAQLEKLLGHPVSSAKLFEHYTVKALAKYLAGIDKPTPGRQHRPDGNHNATTNHNNEDIAIVSMACRLPGGAETPHDFWELLVNGRDATTAVPKDRWHADAVYDADPNIHGKSYCSRGGFVPSFGAFDASFFRISPQEARVLDPTQSMALEVCWEGLERAGYTTQQLCGSQTGVFIGVSNSGVHGCPKPHSLADLGGYTGTGTGVGTLSGRISYVLGLEGPSLTIDTACSSSLVATHLACTALRQRECDMALSGAVTHIPTPGLHVELSRLRGLSPDGRCRAFAAGSQGIGLAEGAATVVLKRLLDAQRDGDRIHGVLRGSAVNHGGRSPGLTVPSGPAQQRLIRTALAASGLRPSDIDYVEAHGTGTKLGDPIEGAALAEVFGGSRSETDEPLWIGSSKSNIGHTQAPAGLVGLIKVVLALQHNALPPTLHAAQPTPAIDWAGAHMALVQKCQPWAPRDGRPRRAAVSAFGIGGTNAHIIVEEPPSRIVAEHTRSVPLPNMLPVVLSGHVDAALHQQADKLHLGLSSSRAKLDDIGDIAYSLATSRNHFARRTVLMVKDMADLLNQLSNVPNAGITSPTGARQEPRLAMLFPGQGSQIPGMGKDLAKNFPVFREALDEVASHFNRPLEKPLLEVMWADEASDAAALLQRTDYAQPALFALGVALWRLWHFLNLQEEVVLGHSVGELTAAHIAGIMDLADACRLVAARSRLMQALPIPGGMVSLEASASEVTVAIETLGLRRKADIAAHNTPMQTVASGNVDALRSLTTHFAELGRRSKMLDVSRAFHSHHMDGMLADFQAVAESVRFNRPTLAIVSTSTGQYAETGLLERPAYWVQQVRRTVRYSDSIRTLADHGVNVFIELGPRPVLCGMGAACLADHSAMTSWLPSLRPNKEEAVAFQEALAELHVRQAHIDWPAYFKPYGCRRVELPTYAFLRERSQRVPGEEYRHSGPSSSPVNHALPLHGKVFQIVWHPVATDHLRPSGTWGLLCPAGNVPWAGEVKAAMLQAGIQVLPVRNLQGAEQLDGLLCLWGSDADIIPQSRNFTAKALTQLQTVGRTGFAPPLVWVTSQAVGTGINDRWTGLGAGPLWGLMRTARSEHPELHLRLADLEWEGAGTIEVNALAQVLMLNNEPECAMRQGQVLVPRMQHVDLAPKQGSRQQLLRRDGAVLITGGLGNLGARIACWLASVHGIRDLVLTSRRGMETPGVDTLVSKLAALGAAATVVPCDAADLGSTKSIMAMFNNGRQLRGVVHTAGIPDAGVLSSLTVQQCATTFSPKVDGAWHLHQLTRRMVGLDLFMVVSSIAGVMGMPGLGIYAAANAFLDALVHVRQSEGLPAVSVAYGPLSGGGMEEGLSTTTRAHLAQFGLEPLTPDESLETLELALRSPRALTVAASLDLERLESYIKERSSMPPLLHSLLGHRTKQVCRSSDLRKVLTEANPEQHEAILLQAIRKTVAKALGYSLPDEVDINRPLHEIGIDSLTAILIRNELATLLGLTLSTNIAFIHPNLTALTQALLSQLQATWADKSSVAPVSASATAIRVTVPSDDFPYLNIDAISKGCVDPSFTFGNVVPLLRPESVFVTGATGFVGAYIVHELLSQGIAAYCLVRAKSMDHAWQRLVGTLCHYDLWKPEHAMLLNPVVGDVTQFRFGLGDKVFNDLADRVDAICHSSALVDWMRPLQDYIGPNVTSTHEVLRLASCSRGKSVHLVSTVATLPRYLGYEIHQDDLESCYATSKWLAERMVAAARWRGARACVYRLPFITASTATGHFRRDRGDFLHNLIAGSIDMGRFPSLDANLSIVLPVDYLCKTIVDVATKNQFQSGQDFDFTRPHAPSFDDYFKLMGIASAGQPVIPFSSWRQQALEYAAAHPTSPLARIAAVLDSSTEESAAAMFKGPLPGAHVLGGDDYPAPLVEYQSIREYVERIFAARKGAQP